MIPLYWINLDTSVERRNRFLSECLKRGIINRRVEAIHHEKPHIGCCLSHIKAIHTAFIEGHELAIICEDDLHFDDNMFNRLHELLGSLPTHVVNDWDILQIAYTEPTFQECIVDSIQQMHTNVNMKDVMGNIIIKGYFMGAVAYLINRKGMVHFLRMMTIQNTSDISAYTLNVSFEDPRAKSEELIYRYVNTYVSMFPIMNYIHTASTINTDEQYVDNNEQNCIITNTIHSQLSLHNYKIIGFYELEYNTHWFFGNKADAQKCLDSML